MAKTPTKKPDAKAPASYASKASVETNPAADNASKYQPTEDAEMDLQQLDPEDGLLKLFTDSVKDIYWAENHLVKALPKMAKAASAPELKATFEDHLEVTHNQIDRLDEIFRELEMSPKGKVCKAMQGLIEEGKEIIKDLKRDLYATVPS